MKKKIKDRSVNVEEVASRGKEVPGGKCSIFSDKGYPGRKRLIE